ncbi:MAG: hypothetical protein ACP5SH_00585 [Syntrophobacteraceae bacterium]
MADTLNVRGLSEQDVKIIERWVKGLRTRARSNEQRQDAAGKKDESTFAVWPLGVKGKLTRDDIYDLP